MSGALPPSHAFLRACALDVAVRKPGNVSAASPGHGMAAPLFLASAEAARHGLFAPGASVGTRIERAMEATLAVAGCNTNLGIVLLCAPVALAFERCAAPPTAPPDAATLRRALQQVLDTLDLDDARAAYRAIAAANPGGLGRAEAQDVAAGPTVGLQEAMRLAADRDRIARQYATGHADLFDTGLAALVRQAAPPRPVDATAVQALFLAFLGRWPDSHIVRKFGAAVAQAVTDEAAPWLRRAENGEPVGDDPAFAAWDEDLKARGLNPGTSADLTVATLFIAGALGVADLSTFP
ncbi:triphosphoribosyl-dephospho-CoA synthase [Methylibium sp.]|jgi:triphosphoribosyl-dephospho-CoA synthase|uniref:triphosphoribosyl-dephospho-CoA synthase n=1 Tax=Methylibium sp. TaxID=2067992 RepID=UPI003D0EF995